MELRMYGLVNYQLTGIQQGIQFGHAVVEYGQLVKKIGEHNQSESKKYDDWADNYKTFIVLNGGTTNTNPEKLGTMNGYLQTLKDSDIFCTPFYEPDLGDQMTSIVFIVDERVFNKTDYLEFEDWVILNHPGILTSDPNTDDYRRIGKSAYQIAKMIKESGVENTKQQDVDVYQDWVKYIGGEKNVFLREFLKNFRLA